MIRFHRAPLLAWLFPPVVLALIVATIVVGNSIKDPRAAAPDLAYAAPLAFAVAGAVIASRVPRNGIGWLLCAFSISIPAEELVSVWIATHPAPGTGMVWAAWVTGWIWAPMLMSLLTYLPLTFPSGRVTGRWQTLVMTFAVAGMAMIVVGNALAPANDAGDPANPVALHGHDGVLTFLTEAGLAPVALAAMLSIASLVRRYRRSAGAERQQYKWFALAIVLAVAGAVVNGVLYEAGQEGAGQVAVTAGLVWLPVALGLSILRYRLYDIDRIISRTVGWALVTIVTVGLYLGCVTLLTWATASVAGESTLAVAAATLLAAAAFGPVRRRIQRAVDRHFNRARYNAVQTVEVYRGRLRDELDVDSVSRHLTTAVATTLQPSTSLLWLRTPEVQR